MNPDKKNQRIMAAMALIVLCAAVFTMFALSQAHQPASTPVQTTGGNVMATSDVTDQTVDSTNAVSVAKPMSAQLAVATAVDIGAIAIGIIVMANSGGSSKRDF